MNEHSRTQQQARLQEIRDAAVGKLDPPGQTTAPERPLGIQVGDLLTFEADQAGAGVLEWAVIRAESQGRWTVVPADLNPLAGSADVTVPATAPCGPLTLRCAFPATVDETTLAQAGRGGTLPGEALAQAQALHEGLEDCKDLETGTSIGSLLQKETEQGLEYQDWLRTTVQPAAAALERPTLLASENFVRAREARRQPFLTAQKWRVAAALFLTAGLSAALVFQWKDSEVAAQRAARINTAQQHQQELQGLQQELVQQTEAARRDRAALEEALATRPTPPPPSPPQAQITDAIVNPQLIWFQPKPDAERGTAEVVPLAPTSQWLTFVLETRHPTPFPRYRATFQKENGTEIWTSDALRAQGVSEIVLSLPANLVPPGRYRFQLEGLRGTQSELLEEFRFRAVRAENEER